MNCLGGETPAQGQSVENCGLELWRQVERAVKNVGARARLIGPNSVKPAHGGRMAGAEAELKDPIPPDGLKIQVYMWTEHIFEIGVGFEDHQDSSHLYGQLSLRLLKTNSG